MGVDLLDSGPDRPLPQRSKRLGLGVASWRNRVRRWRRTTVALAVVLLAAAALVLLRLLAPPPAGGAAWSIGGAPPYDTLPGRVEIPAPSLVSEDGRAVEGTLPLAVDYPGDEASALRAAGLVLGRYCRTLADLGIRARSITTGTWVVIVSDLRTDRPLVAIIYLDYEAGSDDSAGTYRWRGWLDQLHRCR